MSWAVVYLVLSALWLMPGSDIIASGQGQTTDIKVLPESDDDEQCPSMEERGRARNEIHQIIASVIATTLPIITTAAVPTTTSTLTTTMPSTTTSATTMSTRRCTCTDTYACNGTPGWRRVAFINMTDTSYNCPTGLNLTLYSKRTCGRSHTTSNQACSSTTFSVGGLPYSRVCGRIRGYQYGSTSAFGYSSQSQDIDGYYVDGVTLTHGNAGSRQHIWTFTAGLTEVSSSLPNEDCPCDTSHYNKIPIFIGDDYFCESGLHSSWESRYYTVFHSNDVLWDGQGCMFTNTCCQFNNPPWFTKNLPTATTDDIELRLCTNQTPGNEDVPIELIELYVQ